MTTPIQSAKTAKEMLEAVCEDLEKLAHSSFEYTTFREVLDQVVEYRAILKEME